MLVLRAMLYMFVKYLMASGPRCLKCLMFMPSGPVLFVLIEMANCTCVVVSRISLARKNLDCIGLLFVYAIWSDICKLFIKCFHFVYVSDGCFSSKVNASVLLCRCFLLLDSFAMVPHKKCRLCL